VAIALAQKSCNKRFSLGSPLSPMVTDLASGHIDAMSDERFVFRRYIMDLAHDEMRVVICTNEKEPWFHVADNLIQEAVASRLGTNQLLHRTELLLRRRHWPNMFGGTSYCCRTPHVQSALQNANSNTASLASNRVA
jgi:hypothetical protein